MSRLNITTCFVAWVATSSLFSVGRAQDRNVSPNDVLTSVQWKEVDQSVERSIVWLANQKQPNGSFPTLPTGQPGITSLSVLAFLAAGNLPGEGEHGEMLNEAIDFVLDCQRDEGLFSFVAPGTSRASSYQHNGVAHAAHYNHAIAGLMLGEVYGMCGGHRQERARLAIIERGLTYLRDKQKKPKADASERGGWRYYNRWDQSDLSVTSWQIMFMRSAKNAGFDVPEEHVVEAVAYVKRCFDKNQQVFLYRRTKPEEFLSRGVVGSGILAISLSGEHDSPMARQAGQWLLQQSFADYNGGTGPFHYGAFYASQAMYQLGGEYWTEFYPELVTTLLEAQRSDGGWEIEDNYNGNAFGRCYSTSLSVLALTTPYQLLPIYQR